MELYSGIRSVLKRQILFKGIFFALAGVLLWVVCGALIPEDYLSVWGPVIFFGGGLLITLGIVPYKRLSHLEDHPHRLQVSDDRLSFLYKGKPLISLPTDNIKKVEFRDDNGLYGIALWIKSDNKLFTHRSTLCPKHYMLEVKRKHHCDLFFPYFSRNSYERLSDFLDNF
jgi:hypothetical protein